MLENVVQMIAILVIVVGPFVALIAFLFMDSDKPRRELRRVRRAWQAADDALERVDEIARRHTGLVETALTSEIHEVLRGYRRSLRR